MSGSSLPVWAMIFLFGELFIVVISFINPYVPKDQKKKAVYKKSHVIYYTTHVAETVLLLIGFIITIASVVAFVIEDYHDFALFFSNAIIGNIMAVLLTILGFFLAQIVMILTIIIVEELVIEDTQKYYERRYNVMLLNVEEFEPKDTKNPRE